MSSPVINLRSSFEADLTSATEPVVVLFLSDGQEPCRAMTSAVRALTDDVDGVRVHEVDVEEHAALAGRHHVQVVPTAVVFDGGRAVRRLTGVRPKERLRQELAEVVPALAPQRRTVRSGWLARRRAA